MYNLTAEQYGFICNRVLQYSTKVAREALNLWVLKVMKFAVV